MTFNILLILLNIIFLATGIKKFWGRGYGLSKSDINILQWLFVYHQLMSIFFSWYVQKFAGDANEYWFRTTAEGLYSSWQSFYGTGTTFVMFLNYPLVKYLNISFILGGLLYGFVGYLGLVYLFIIIRKFTGKYINIYAIPVFPLILFAPNLNFWSSGIGKDALMFFGIVLFLYCLFDIKRKLFLGIFALVLSYHIRPPVALFLIFSAFFGVFIASKIKTSYKIVLSIAMIASVALLFNKVLTYVELDNLQTSSIDQFSKLHTTLLSQDARSGVNTADYPLPLKIFTFLYRPLFFDITNALSVVASFENLFLLWLSYVLIFKLNLYKLFRAAPFQIKSTIFYFVISALGFSLTLGNLGIMLRMKIMVEPALLIFLFWAIVYLESNKNRNNVNQKQHYTALTN